MKEKSSSLRKNLIKMYASFEDLQSKLMKFEDFLKSEKISILTIATNEYFPAVDCAHIIRAFPSKRSGFYWIKNECNSKPLRVYCDFDSYDKKAGLDYLIFNNYQRPNTQMTNVKNFKDIRLACAKLGLEPIQIKNIKMLKIIFSLLYKMSFNLNDSKIIPLAYDYNCDFAKCSGLFKSLNDENSSEINELLTLFAHNDKKMFITKNIFEDNGQIIKNVAAIGLINSVVYLKLEDYPVSAVICSSNDDGNKKKSSSIDLECDSNLRSDSFSSFELYSNLRFVCPKGCSTDPTLIYGSGLYTDNSSICKAAVHAGVISDLTGGIFELKVEPGSKNYIGSSTHNVETLDYPDKWDRSFRVKKYNPYCPIDKMKDYIKGGSFLELENKSETKSHSEFVDLFKEFVEKSKNFASNPSKQAISLPELPGNSAKNINSLVFDNNSLKLLSNFFSFLQSKSQITENQKLKERFENTSQALDIPSVRTSDTDSSKKTATKAKISNQITVMSSPEVLMTTQEAIVSLNTAKDKERSAIDTFRKIGSDFKSIIGKASSQVTILKIDKELGLNNQNLVYTTIKKKVKDIHKRIYEIIRKSKQKISLMEHLLKLDKTMIDNFMKRDTFQEDYVSKSIYDNYQIFNNKKGVGEPAKWEYYMYNLDGHSKTIMQKNTFIDSKTGSHLIVKNRDFYDFELKFSVLIRDKNTFGVAFRYKDPYNYYIIELSKQEKGFKRVRKFVKGNPQVLDTKYDGGFNLDVWYNFKIRAVQSKIIIYMTDQRENIDKRYEKIFEFIDNELVHGTIAFTSFGIKFLLIDNISIVPISCTNFDEKKGDLPQVVTPTCPRFSENLIKNFLNRWKVIDPIEYFDGPSNWTRKYNIEDREIVLTQTSRVYSSTPNEEGTIYLLNDPSKMCMMGKFSIKFKASNNGIVGIIFRKTAQNNYYLLEVGGEKEKFVRLRKKMDGIFQTLSTKPLVGYSIDNWTNLVLYMNQDKFNAYMTTGYMHDSLVKVWDEDIVDTDLRIGYLGLTTYKTSVIFVDIELRPFDDLDAKEELLYVDEESLESKHIFLIIVPKRKVPDSLMGKINTHIPGFSWSKCLAYPTQEDRLKYCNVLFHSDIQLNRCKVI
jgi:hypothetical protein